jgi:magnesium transporter
MSKIIQPRAFPDDSVGSIMSNAIPTCKSTDTFAHILKILTQKTWDDIDYVFVIDEGNNLLGYINMATLIQSDHETPANKLMEKIEVALHPHDDQEKAVFYAVKYDADIVPVVDHDEHFVGAVISRTIIDVMHEEHLEDTLYSSGLHGKNSHLTHLTTAGILDVIKSRAPWLLAGLLAGMGLGWMSSWFEESLKQYVALAYFIPVVAYIAGSVGTQSQAIIIRALAISKPNYTIYLMRELVIGFLIGILIGAIGGFGAFLITGTNQIGLIVSISLFVACVVSSLLGSAIPITFKIMNRDPALASGPLATALQDIISVLVYFLVAIWLI